MAGKKPISTESIEQQRAMAKATSSASGSSQRTARSKSADVELRRLDGQH
jgi:hypothetical protein